MEARCMGSRLDRIMDWPRIARKAGYRVDGLARMLGVTPRQLERYILKSIKLSPKAWMDGLRIKRGEWGIRRDKSIKEASQELGYKHPQDFARAFKRVTGTTPSGYRSRN